MDALFKAINKLDVEAVSKAAYDVGPDINKKNKKGVAPIHAAVQVSRDTRSEFSRVMFLVLTIKHEREFSRLN